MESFDVQNWSKRCFRDLPTLIKFTSGAKLRSCNFLDFCEMKLVRFKCFNVSTFFFFYIGSWKSKISQSVSTLKISAGSSGMFLLRHLPPSLFSLRMFSLLSVEKILMSVSLVRKSTRPTHTEQNWADLTAAPHGPPRSHLYSQAKAKHCETTQTVFSSV